jgi:hypothetical protein
MKISLVLHLISFDGCTALEVYSSPTPITVETDDEAESMFIEFQSHVASKAQHAASGHTPDVLVVYGREQKFDEIMIAATTWRNTIARVYLEVHE